MCVRCVLQKEYELTSEEKRAQLALDIIGRFVNKEASRLYC